MTPGLAAAAAAASMHNPLFYERQRMRASTYNIPASCIATTRPSTAA